MDTSHRQSDGHRSVRHRGLTALVVHKSVESLQLQGVPSLLIEGMEFLHACIWVIDALAVLWLCGTAAVKFCKKVTRGKR